MNHRRRHPLSIALLGLAILVAALHGQQASPADRGRADEPFRFRSGVELINVTATVSDASGRFVGGLRQEDFAVYEDGEPVEITQFSAERVPVSLGIALDTSGSMAGDKIREAESALNRFVYELLGPADEMFLYRFSNFPILLQGWTTNRQMMERALGHLTPSGGTALYDTIEDAIPLAQLGRHQKKALLIISDGNDTASRAEARQVKRLIRESEVLVYAVGIDGVAGTTPRTPAQPLPPRVPLPGPSFPFPGRPGGRFPFPPFNRQLIGQGGAAQWGRSDDRVNVAALRELTDDSGGRTEIIRSARDLDPATAGIANELSRQYYLAYPSTGRKDGQWHTIRVEVKRANYRVRARRGYVAS